MGNIGAPEIILLLLVALLLFGAKRLPEIGRSLGSGMREFKDSVTGNTPSHTETTTQLPGRDAGHDPHAAARERNRSLGQCGCASALRAGSGTARRRRSSSTSRSCGSGCSSASARVLVGFIVAYVFHRRLIHWLELELPKGDRRLTTLTIGEPFMTSIWLVGLRRLPARAAGHHLAGVGVLPARVRHVARAHAARLRPHRDVDARGRRRVRLLDRAAEGVALPRQLRQVAVPVRSSAHATTSASRRRCSSRWRSSSSCRSSSIGLTRIGIVQTRTLRRSRRVGYFVVCCVGVAAAGRRPGDDDHRDGPAARALRGVDLGLGAARAPRRTARHVSRRHVSSAVSADWVVPVDGPPIEGGVVRFEEGRIVEVGTRPRRASLRGRGDRARLRQRAHPSRVRDLRRLRRRDRRSARGSSTHIPPQGADSTPAGMLAVARLGALELAPLRHHDDRRLQLLRRRRDCGRPS